MKLKLRDGVYQVEFEDFTGKRRRLSTGEKDKAVAQIKGLDIMRQAMLDDAAPATRASVSDRTPTLTYALEECLRLRWANQRSGGERKYMVRALQRDIGHWPIHTITYAKLEDYCVLRLGEEHEDSPATVNRKMSAIGTALRQDAKRTGVAVPSMPHYSEDNIRERYLTDAEETTILGWLAKRGVPDADYAYMHALAIVLLDGGFRCTEGLEADRSKFNGTHLWLRHGGDTKNNKGRVIPLTLRARAALEQMFASEFHGKVDSDWVGRRWRTCMSNVKITGVTVHTLRHTCASRLIQRGVDIYLVSKWLGHSSVEVTKRYAHLNTDSLDKAGMVLDAAAPPLDAAAPAVADLLAQIAELQRQLDCANPSVSGTSSKFLITQAVPTFSVDDVPSRSGETPQAATGPAALGTVIGAKLLIDGVISSAKGETRSGTQPDESMT